MAASEALLAAADATDNPALVSWALLAYGFARRDAEPAAAYEVLRTGLAVAQESGNRQIESGFAVSCHELRPPTAIPWKPSTT